MTTHTPHQTEAPEREWLTEKEAAEHYGLTAGGLRYMRSQGYGPKFSKFGRAVRYHRRDLDEWEATCRDDNPTD